MRLGKIIEVRFGDAKNKDQHSICIAFLMLKVKLQKDTAIPKSHYIAKPCSDVETCMEGNGRIRGGRLLVPPFALILPF